MDEFYFSRGRVPAFGNWDCNDGLPFTQCFESARPAGALHYSYPEERDLYVAGDLYQNHVVTPAMIVVPRQRGGRRNPKERERKKESWAKCDCECDGVKSAGSPASDSPTFSSGRAAPKPVDEDLYKISPHLLRRQAKRKRGWGIFSSCLRLTCAC